MPNTLAPLFSDQGWSLLTSLEALPATIRQDSAYLRKALSKEDLEPGVAASVLTQLSLRDEAEKKFGSFARMMVFTREGLEQATRMVVAAQHAHRFLAAGVSLVADLGCGIGGDVLAMSGLGLRVLAFDIDEDAAAAAAANLRSFPEAKICQGDVNELEMSILVDKGVDAIFADPARRLPSDKGGGRIFNPEKWSPSLSAVMEWRTTIKKIGVKVAPGIAHDALPDDCHAQWVSVDGDLVEASLWTPSLAPEGPGRSALVIKGKSGHTMRDSSISSATAPVPQAPVGKIGQIVAEPDDAVMRAGLVAHLAESINARLLSERIAWLTADNIAPTPFASRFEVVDVVEMRPKAINVALKKLEVGRVEIKKRGADVNPERLRSQLKLEGQEEATIIATRVAGRHRALITKRLSDQASG